MKPTASSTVTPERVATVNDVGVSPRHCHIVGRVLAREMAPAERIRSDRSAWMDQVLLLRLLDYQKARRAMAHAAARPLGTLRTLVSRFHRHFQGGPSMLKGRKGMQGTCL